MKRFLFGALFLLLSACARRSAEQLVSGDESVRQAALRRLEESPPSKRREVLPHVAARLADPNANVRRRASQALARAGADAVNPLIRALQHKDARARAAAAETLGFLGGDAKTAAGPLVEAERDPDPDVRMWAAVSLARVKEAMTPTELNLYRLLYGKDEVVAPPASALRAADPGDTPQALLARLRGQGLKGRASTVLALVEKGPLAVPALMDAVKDPDGNVRDGAAQALRLLTRDKDDADEALLNLLREADPACRAAHAAAFPSGAAPGARALAALTEKGPLCVRLEAARALGALGPGGRAGAEALKAAAEDPHPLLRQAALRALARVDKTAPDEAQADLAKRLNGLWSEAMGRLGKGEIEEALSLFATPQRDAHRAAFLSLGDGLPAVARGLDCGLAFSDAFGPRAVVLEGRALVDGVEQELRVQFVRDEKDEWKVRGF